MRVSTCEVTQILTVLVSICLTSVSAQISGENDNCLLQESTVPILRDMIITHGGRSMMVPCSGEITLNKCEGACESSVSPSVTRYPGYRQVCRCCKETTTETKEVTLTCYRNGQEIPNFQQPLQVMDITGCACQECTG